MCGVFVLHACARPCGCGGQKLTSGCHHCPRHLLKQGLTQNLELAISARLDGQPSQEICLALAPTDTGCHAGPWCWCWETPRLAQQALDSLSHLPWPWLHFQTDAVCCFWEAHSLMEPCVCLPVILGIPLLRWRKGWPCNRIASDSVSPTHPLLHSSFFAYLLILKRFPTATIVFLFSG